MSDKKVFLKDQKSATFTEEYLNDSKNNIDSEKAEKYFGKGWVDILKYREDKSGTGNIKNWLRYRICNHLLEKKTECDLNDRVFKLFKAILDTEPQEDGNKMIFNYKNVKYQTDTMNSFATLFNQFIRDSYNNGGPFGFKNKFERDRYFLYSIDFWYYNLSPCKKYLFDRFNTFAGYTHCLANMVLVPYGYNSKRNKKTNDFWDLSLIDLKENNSKDFFEMYKKKMLLEDWFENDDVKLLFNRHSYYNLMPKGGEYIECLDNIIKMIESRAKALANFEKLKDFLF